MNISTLALNNIKANLNRYIMYFFAMVFSVFTIFTFLSLAENPSVVEKVFSDVRYARTITGFTIVILVFVFFYLISSNNSFIRARKKEISIYSLLGMENSKIAKLLFLETLFFGGAAIVVGILLGIFFSKLVALLLLKMIMSTYSGNVGFSLGANPILLTTIIFLITFCIMGLSTLRIVSRFKLIDLFKANRVAEKRPRGSILMLISSFVFIFGGYFLSLNAKNTNEVVFLMLPVTLIVIIGTFLFFFGGLKKILNRIKKHKAIYYKGDNLVATSMLTHRSNSLAGTMATIAILVAVSVTMVSFGYLLFITVEKQTDEMLGFDLYYYTDNQEVRKNIDEVFERYPNEIKGEYSFNRYNSYPQGENLGFYQGYLDSGNSYLRTYSESQYNKMTNLSRNTAQLIAVPQGEAVIMTGYNRDYSNFTNSRLKYDNLQLEASILVGEPYSYGSVISVILNDDDFNHLLENGEIETISPLTAINYTNAKKSDKLAQELASVLSGNVGSYRLFFYTYNQLLGNFGVLCFTGFFMCAMMILMSASILYFKQITLATEEKYQYNMIEKMGIEEEIKRKIIAKRIKPVFFVPLVIGIIHSVFAMYAADTGIFKMILPMGNTYSVVLKTSLVIYGLYSLVYLGFYFITNNGYAKVIDLE